MKGSYARILVSLLLISGAPTWLEAQHLGAASDNYITTQKVIYNPASMADAKSYADIRLFGISQLFQNNYVYFPGGNFNETPRDNFSQGRNYAAYSETDFYGPAFTIVKKKRAFGASFRVRNHLVARQIPSSVAKFAFEGLNYLPLHNQYFIEKDFWVKNMAWGELALSYAQIIRRRGNSILTAGGSLKFLSGAANVSFSSKEFDFIVDDQNLNVPNIRGQTTLTVPGALKGFGLGADIGVEYKYMLTDNNSFHVPHHPTGGCLVKEYKFKIGVSMLDFGFINFNKTTTNYKFKNDSLFLGGIVPNPPSGVSEVTNALNQAISNGKGNTTIKESVFATTPLSFVLQADYNFENNIYLNAQLLIGMQQRNFSGAERMTTFTLTPRYELRKFTFAIPISVYRYGSPGIGVYARLWWVSVGVNNVMPYLSGQDMYSVDAYASINIPIFTSNACKSYEASKGNYCPKPKLKLFNFGHKKKKKGGQKKDGKVRNKKQRQIIRKKKRKSK